MDNKNKIIRTICYFSSSPSSETLKKVNEIAEILTDNSFSVQTKRICSPDIDRIIELDTQFAGRDFIFGIGSVERDKIIEKMDQLLVSREIYFNLDLTNREIILQDAQLLFEIIGKNTGKSFHFAYVFNNPSSSPYFPSGIYHNDGFSIGLQPTDLSEGCPTLEEWLEKMKAVWVEVYEICKKQSEFLGIDSSIAPLFTGKSSLINFIKRLDYDFSHSVTSDIYLKITKFIKNENPKPIGLCGIMFPCLEDFELAEEYEKGNFSIERNVYLSLHSGLGIDTYPVGIDEKPERVLEILRLLQGLSNKYKKPLSARFVSDGKAKIGDETDFKNQYLKDIIVKPL